MSAPEILETDRLIIRRPRAEDATIVFERYASDTDVTKYLGWPRHRELGDTRTFLEFSEAEWEKTSVGPYLVFSRTDGTLLGSTGLSLESDSRAATGYVFAKDAWGQGYATESLQAMVKLAKELELTRVQALCHPDHRASARVLEKCGFELEGTLRRYIDYPNLGLDGPGDALIYALVLR